SATPRRLGDGERSRSNRKRKAGSVDSASGSAPILLFRWALFDLLSRFGFGNVSRRHSVIPLVESLVARCLGTFSARRWERYVRKHVIGQGPGGFGDRGDDPTRQVSVEGG